ncbi:alcohol dehydrogenase [Metallosphaera tengchongensis]|uniref:Alcohol dehydrogenase n=1 Tax=Metallosphaera tengchongensis TaxID=1532350 RepID=A0A6N0NX82_9CREN|nr:alcohol dehydrogenase [Metallosphaera tengchongensis]QKQ99709.1 alcohol dehydrogenase [Metallosphaera tengchongensis]
MKSIVFNQGIIVSEQPETPIGSKSVEILPEKVLVDGIENSIFLGLLWVKPGTILGSIGIGKIRDVGVDLPQSMIGKRSLVFPLSEAIGGIGTEVNGLLCERAVVPVDSVITFSENIDDRYLILPHLSVALDIMEKIGDGSTLIIGSGLTAVLIHIFGRDMDINIMYDDGSFRLSNNNKVVNIDKQWDNIVISTMRGWARHLAQRLVKPSGHIFIPKFVNSWPSFIPQRSFLVRPRYRSELLEYLNSKEVEHVIKTYLGYSEDALSSIPTTKPGIIVDVKKVWDKINISAIIE